MKHIHALKIWPQEFLAVKSGIKRFEYRKNDSYFCPGDLIILQEWDPKTQECTGEMISVWVTYLVNGPEFGIPEGYCVMSIEIRKAVGS